MSLKADDSKSMIKQVLFSKRIYQGVNCVFRQNDDKKVFHFVYLACPQTEKSRNTHDLKAMSEKNDIQENDYGKSQDFVVDDLSIF